MDTPPFGERLWAVDSAVAMHGKSSLRIGVPGKYTYRGASMHTWREFERVGRELQALSPALLTPDDRLRVEASPRSRDLLAFLKSDGRTYYLLAVNTAIEPCEAVFHLRDVPSIGKVPAMFETKAARSKRWRLFMSHSCRARFTRRSRS